MIYWAASITKHPTTFKKYYGQKKLNHDKLQSEYKGSK